MLTGRSPSSAVTPDSVNFQPSPSAAKPRFSSHMGSYRENGTYISTASMSRRGSVIPACRWTSAAQSRRLCHRFRLHRGAKDERRSMGERDSVRLLDGVHQLVKAPIVLVWDRLNTHVSRAMRKMIDDRDWLTVFLLPAYSPEPNPV